MRLGEFRTKTKDSENKKEIRLSIYNIINHNRQGFVDLDIDMVTDDYIYLRVIGDENNDWKFWNRWKCHNVWLL